MDFGRFRGSIFYREMVRKVTCYRCLKDGHKASDCLGEEVCKRCKVTGHRMSTCPNPWGVAVEARRDVGENFGRAEKEKEKPRHGGFECGEFQVEEERELVEKEKSTDEGVEESSEGEEMESDG